MPIGVPGPHRRCECLADRKLSVSYALLLLTDGTRYVHPLEHHFTWCQFTSGVVIDMT